jgi:hypothetical protein
MSDMREEERDRRLGAALRELPVPGHLPEFRAVLRAALRRELAHRQELDQEAGRSLGTPDPVWSPPSPNEWPQTDRIRRHLPRRRTIRRLEWGVGLAAAVAAGLVLFLVVVGLPGTTPRAATAAQVRVAVARAWAGARSIQGVLVSESEDQGAFGKGEMKWKFILDAEGNFRLTGITPREDTAYDARRGVERGLDYLDSGQLVASERVRVAPGRPDQGPSSNILDRHLGSVVRALAAGDGGQVKETTYEGRKAWLLDTDVRVNLLLPDISADHMQITVDQRTGFPVRVVSTRSGEFKSELRIEGLRVDQPLPEQAFTLEFPPGVETQRTNVGFRRVPLDGVRSIVGYGPLVPASVPDGYKLAEVTVSLKRSFTGTEGGNPYVGRIVSLSYRRGLDQFVVTTRPVGKDPTLWSDPLGTGEGFRDVPEHVRLSGGALDGRAAQVMIDPLVVPHLWAMTDQLVVTVSGDLSGAELLQVAGSLGTPA